MTIQEFKQLSDQEKELIYGIAKVVAESDSIGEQYSGYCDEYDKDMFACEIKEWENPKPYFEFGHYYISAAISIFEITKEHYDNIPT